MVITLDPYKVQQYGLSLQAISQAISDSSKTSPAGDVKGNLINVLIDIKNPLNTVQQFNSIIVVFLEDKPNANSLA